MPRHLMFGRPRRRQTAQRIIARRARDRSQFHRTADDSQWRPFRGGDAAHLNHATMGDRHGNSPSHGGGTRTRRPLRKWIMRAGRRELERRGTGSADLETAPNGHRPSSNAVRVGLLAGMYGPERASPGTAMEEGDWPKQLRSAEFCNVRVVRLRSNYSSMNAGTSLLTGKCHSGIVPLQTKGAIRWPMGFHNIGRLMVEFESRAAAHLAIDRDVAAPILTEHSL